MTTLSRIKTKVRRLTATPDKTQLPDSVLEEYVNDFYQQDLIADLKLFSLHKTYTFFTDKNVDTYDLPVNTYNSINPPVYVQGKEMNYTQDRTNFFRLYPKNQTEDTIATGDGSTANFTETVDSTPVRRNSFNITAQDTAGNTLNVQDDGNGNLTGDIDSTGTNTIDYSTGDVDVTFSANVASSEDVLAQYDTFVAARPDTVLFFDNKFTFRPIPDQGYRVEVEVWQKPTQALSANDDNPDINQWWQYIAFGTAIKVLEDRLDVETIAKIQPMYEYQKELVLNKTANQYTNERTATIYEQDQHYNYGFYNGFRS